MLKGAPGIGSRLLHGEQGICSYLLRTLLIRQDAANLVQGSIQDGQGAEATAGEGSRAPYRALPEPQQSVCLLRGTSWILPMYELSGGG